MHFFHLHPSPKSSQDPPLPSPHIQLLFPHLSLKISGVQCVLPRPSWTWGHPLEQGWPTRGHSPKGKWLSLSCQVSAAESSSFWWIITPYWSLANSWIEKSIIHTSFLFSPDHDSIFFKTLFLNNRAQECWKQSHIYSSSSKQCSRLWAFSS